MVWLPNHLHGTTHLWMKDRMDLHGFSMNLKLLLQLFFFRAKFHHSQTNSKCHTISEKKMPHHDLGVSGRVEQRGLLSKTYLSLPLIQKPEASLVQPFEWFPRKKLTRLELFEYSKETKLVGAQPSPLICPNPCHLQIMGHPSRMLSSAVLAHHQRKRTLPPATAKELPQGTYWLFNRGPYVIAYELIPSKNWATDSTSPDIYPTNNQGHPSQYHISPPTNSQPYTRLFFRHKQWA